MLHLSPRAKDQNRSFTLGLPQTYSLARWHWAQVLKIAPYSELHFAARALFQQDWLLLAAAQTSLALQAGHKSLCRACFKPSASASQSTALVRTAFVLLSTAF